MNYLDSPLFSVVTVVFNDVNNIANTIESVISQTFLDREYIVIDGGSSDGTLNQLWKFKSKINIFITEPDNGLYHAMNKAIAAATGEWIIFINSGDVFASNDILERVSTQIREDDEFLYGSHYWMNAGRVIHVPTRPLETMWQRISFSHQSLFVRLSTMKKYGFDERFSIVADYHFYYRCYQSGATFRSLGFPLSKILSGGVSERQFMARTMQRFKVVIKYGSNANYISVIAYYFTLLGSYFRRSVQRKLFRPATRIRSLIPTVTTICRRIMSREEPLVTIVVPNYNNRPYLTECLESICRQSYRKIEVIVVDDCSNDGSVELVRSIKDTRVSLLINGENTGVSYSRNRGICSAKGNFVTTLDSDDVLLSKWKLESELRLLLAMRERSRRPLITFSNISQIGEDSSWLRDVGTKFNIRQGDLFECLLERSCFIPRDYLCETKLIKDVGLFDEGIPIYEDWELKLRLSLCADWYYTGIMGIGYRQHNRGLSSVAADEHQKWKTWIREKYLMLDREQHA